MKFVWGILITLFFFFTPSQVFAVDVVINEFAPNSQSEWVEFYNSLDNADYLKTYYIDDDEDFNNDVGKPKKALTELNVDSVHYPHISLGEGYLNNDGDWVVLFDSQGNIVDKYHYGSVPDIDKTIGRAPDQTGEFAFLESATKGAVNSAKKIDPTPSPSPSPTPTPTAAASPTPTTKPTVKPTSQPTIKALPTPVEEVFSAQTGTYQTPGYSFAQSSPSSEETPQYQGGSSGAAIVLIFAGIGFVGVALLPFIKRAVSSYNTKTHVPQNPSV